MLLEIAEEAHIMISLAKKFRCQKIRVYCLRRSSSVNPLEAIELSQNDLNGKFLLVVERFGITGESNISFQDVVDKRISLVESNLINEISTVKSEIKNEMSLMKSEIKNEFSSLLNSINSIIGEKSKSLPKTGSQD